MGLMRKTIFSFNDNYLFYALLVLMFWLPIPLGSNRPWAVAIMEIWLFALLIFWLLGYYLNKYHLTSFLRQIKFPLSILLLFCLLTFFQSLSDAFGISNWLAPQTSTIYQDAFEHLGINPEQYYGSLSLNTYLSQTKLIESLSYVSLMLLIFLLINSRKRLEIFVYTLIASGVFQAVYGTVMTLSGIEYGFFVAKDSYLGNATGTFVNRNHFAGYLEMALALGIGVLISSLYKEQAKNKSEKIRRFMDILLGNKIRLRIALILMVIGLVSSHSRMGNGAFFISLSIMGIIYLLAVKKPPRNIIILFVSLFVIDLLIVGNWFGVDKLVNRFEQTDIIVETESPLLHQKSPLNKQQTETNENQQTLQFYRFKFSSKHETRDEVYRDTLNMIEDHMYIGSGAGTYANSFLKYRGKDIRQYYDHAHNDYLELLAEYGLTGFLLLMSLCLYCFYCAISAIRTRNSTFMQGLGFASAMGMLSILLHGITDFNLQIPANTTMFVVLCGLALISKYRKFRVRKNS